MKYLALLLLLSVNLLAQCPNEDCLEVIGIEDPDWVEERNRGRIPRDTCKNSIYYEREFHKEYFFNFEMNVFGDSISDTLYVTDIIPEHQDLIDDLLEMENEFGRITFIRENTDNWFVVITECYSIIKLSVEVQKKYFGSITTKYLIDVTSVDIDKVKNYFTIEGNNLFFEKNQSNVFVSSLNGNLLKSYSSTRKIDLSGLPYGMLFVQTDTYYFTIIKGEGFYVKSFVIK